MARKTLLWIFLIGLVLFFLFGHHMQRGRTWNVDITYPAGEATNAADVSYGSGYQPGTYVGHDWTAQPF